MFFNKLWFTFYLSEAYSSIKTSLDNETVINKILDSPFDVGKHVKSVHLNNIQKPINLNELDVSNDILGKIMKETPNVRGVSISRGTYTAKQDKSCQSCMNHDWPYFSMVLIGVKCWELQRLPNLGENNMVSAANYYACAYYSRRALKKLEISFNTLVPQDIGLLKEFTKLKALEVHKNLINGLNDIGSLLQFTPKLQELTIRFATGRVYQSTKMESTSYPGIKKLWLYNFNLQDNNELLAVVQRFPALENLYIFGERDKTWLSQIDELLTVNSFLKIINLIPEYEIMIPEDTQETKIIERWLESIKSSKREVFLSHSYNQIRGQNYIKSQSDTVMNFYGGSVRSTPILKYTKTNDLTNLEIFNIFKELENEIIISLQISGIGSRLGRFLESFITENPSYLEQIVISDALLYSYSNQTIATPVLPRIKRITFRQCNLHQSSLKLFVNEFNSLEYIEFDTCSFGGVVNIDYGNVDIESIKLVNFQKMGYSRNSFSRSQSRKVIAISIYVSVQGLTRFFCAIDNSLIEITKDTFEILRGSFRDQEIIVFDIKVKSLQQLSLQMTKISEIFDMNLFH